MLYNFKFLVIIALLLYSNCTENINSSEMVDRLQDGRYVLTQTLGTLTTQQELSFDNTIFHYNYKKSDETTDLDLLTFAGTFSNTKSVLYLQVETGYEKIALSDSSFVTIHSIPEKKAVLIDFSLGTLKVYGGAIVFRRDNSDNRNIWGKWKSSYFLGTGFTAIPVGKVFKNNDSLTYLTLNNDSTWSFQTFSALSQVMVSTGKVKQIIEIDKLSPSILKDSMFVFDSKNDLLLAFWDFKQIPDIFIQTKL